ncbi:TetR/AcrR family transcriptional regulator [Cryptosporangium aurantiacum]|uniref:Transcriptional regulator, TetR family n=1 Tax=Cryptosporangium aurantiacum TaxID=134849 RepID=A0A1M7RK17_9ACTN|nr:TetR/AcrR family transcriptional regulator [Cryptosporangium aurantiacum]SHN46501.1 transcriptional regulator, TetR family [Cryptosporangium aurantiacum]
MSTPTPDRRDRYLRAAVGCFARYGYRRTSMDVIAQAAGVSRPTLYQYYRGKEEIFRAAAEWGFEDLAERAETEARMPGEPADRLCAVLVVMLRMHEPADRTLDRFPAELIDEVHGRADDLWLAFEERLLAVLAALLDRFADRLDISGAPALPVVLLYGAKGIALRAGSAGERRELLRQLVGITVRGLAREPVTN